jgi:hypothetical protein
MERRRHSQTQKVQRNVATGSKEGGKVDNENVLTAFRNYLAELIARIPRFADLCSADEGIAFALVMSETVGTPLAELTLAQIRQFKRKLRDGGRSNPFSSGMANEVAKPLVMAQRKLTLQRGYLAIQYFLDFRKDVLKVKKGSVQ